MAANGRKKVMIVDDALLMREAIVQLLKNDERYDVVAVCENGLHALKELKGAAPDLILVDMEMPTMDGLTFIRSVRPRTRACIVVLSSHVAVGSKRASEARRLGADAVVDKPSGAVSFDLAERDGRELLETLRRLLP